MPTSQHRWPVWPWLVLTVAGVVITATAAIVGTAAQNDPGAEPAAAKVTITATEFFTNTVTATVTVAPPPATPSDALLDGIHRVGVEVQPGVYQTTGRAAPTRAAATGRGPTAAAASSTTAWRPARAPSR